MKPVWVFVPYTSINPASGNPENVKKNMSNDFGDIIS